jgi:outer membrane protein TolC
VFDSGRTRNRAEATARQADSIIRRRRDFASVIDLQVRSAWLDYQEATRRQDVTMLAVEQAEENLRVARDRYRAGAGTNTEVLDAETLRALSRNNHDNAHFDTALSRLRLARATGRL